MTDALRVAAARRWFRERGHDVIEAGGARIVATPDAPDVWDANFALPDGPRADRGADPQAMLAALDAAMPHSAWRVVVTDALCDPAVEASLALAGFTQGDPLIEMLATDPVRPAHPPAPVTLQPVRTEADWAALVTLVEIDHAEGKRTGEIDAEVGAGLIATMRRRCPGEYHLLIADGTPAGYGLALACPNGLGLLENLFTLPAMRGRGLMSAFIAEAVARLRAGGCDGVFLDALAHEEAKGLYARLGFRPVAVARQWTRLIAVNTNRPSTKWQS